MNNCRSLLIKINYNLPKAITTWHKTFAISNDGVISTHWTKRSFPCETSNFNPANRKSPPTAQHSVGIYLNTWNYK